MLSFAFTLLQAASPQDSAAGKAVAATTEHVSAPVLEIMTKGGVVMIFLALCMLIAIYFIIEWKNYSWHIYINCKINHWHSNRCRHLLWNHYSYRQQECNFKLYSKNSCHRGWYFNYYIWYAGNIDIHRSSSNIWWNNYSYRFSKGWSGFWGYLQLQRIICNLCQWWFM